MARQLIQPHSASCHGVEERDAERFKHAVDARLGSFEARVLEAAQLKPGQSFHPKAWRFEHGALGVAFVGSSNISRTALAHGIEWNLRIHRQHDIVTWKHLQDGFEALWQQATPLSDTWIASYQERLRDQKAAEVLAALRDEAEQLETPTPRPVQQEALERLARMRAEGSTRALVVFATELGKTWLAAFDVQQFKQQEPRARILFIAHRVELLEQAAKTFRRLWPAIQSTEARMTIEWEIPSACLLALVPSPSSHRGPETSRPIWMTPGYTPIIPGKTVLRTGELVQARSPPAPTAHALPPLLPWPPSPEEAPAHHRAPTAAPRAQAAPPSQE